MPADYDLVILGQGSAAFAAAIKADELGVKTALIGKNRTKGALIGGTCVNVGCVPSKRLLTVGLSYQDSIEGPFAAIEHEKGRLDFGKAISEKDALVRRFRKEKYADVLQSLKNVDHLQGAATFTSSKEVRVGEKTIRGKKFLIATGARASIPVVRGIGSVDCLTNEEALSLRSLPASMLVVGGRALGLEFAQMYAHFGTEVTVLQRSERILPEHEPEISAALKDSLEEEGIRIETGVSLEEFSQSGNTKTVRASVDGTKEKFEAEALLLATGRVPNTDRLGAERAGVKLDDRGFVKVDDQMRTSAPYVWAAGDVIGEPMLETIAAKEGSVAVSNAFTATRRRIDFDEVPRAVFTSPEVASVGLSDAQANGQGIKCACGVLPLDLVSKASIIGDTRGLVKIVAERASKRIVGVHIMAPHAADLIMEGVMAVKFKLTIDDVIDTVHVFPTLSEGFKLAAQSFYRDVGKMSCCTE
jgi:mercuric reductase